MKPNLTHHLLAALLGVAFTTTLHAQLVVTTSVDEDNGDANPGTGGGTGTSLREAVNYASPGDTITFTNTLSGATIVLTGGQITISTNLAVDASSLADGISVSGNNSSRVVLVPSGVTASLTGLTIRDGNAGAQGGGGIQNQGTLMLTNCTLTANSGTVGAGLANDGGGVATVMACTFSTNTASAVGGGVQSAGDATIIQSTFGGNSAAGAGGGAVNAHATSVSLVLDGCTISGNSATNGSGGGVRRAGGTVTITNSIVAGNTASTGDDLSGVTPTGPNLIGGDPLLAPFGDYGGPTQTMPPLPGSPAIDGATNGTAYATDQRGLARVVNGTADLGAVESGQAIPTVDYTVVTTVDDFLSEWTDNGVSLRSAVAFAPNDSTITFTNTLSGATIGLTNGQVTVAKNLTIDASALPGGVILDGMTSNRVFMCNGGTTNALVGLTIVGGVAPRGAGIRNNGVLTVDQCTVGNNVASIEGGGIYNPAGATLTVQNSTLSGNTANNYGGGIYGGTVTVENSTLSGNTADKGGGVTALLLTVENSTLWGNAASSWGGGIYTSDSCTVQNSTLTGNTASDGGGIFGWDLSEVTVQNSTISGNTATNTGGGIISAGPLQFRIENSIIAGNSASSGTNIAGSITSSTGVNLTNGTPMLAPLGNYGGPTQTMPPLPGSPAIDAGISTANTPATDQRGFARVVGTLDIGAVEVNNVVTAQEDSVAGSLREIVGGASPGATITFTNTLSGATIVLTNGQITISTNLAIDASSLPDGVSVSGNNSSRVFEVPSGVTASLTGLTIRDGAATGGGIGSYGGGILNQGTLTVTNCTLTSNSAAVDGGGLANQSGGVVTVMACTFSTNTASAVGGGVYSAGDATIIQSTFGGNTAAGAGGGAVNAYSSSVSLVLDGCTISGNSATGGSGQGGGVRRAGGTVTVTNSIVAGNTASTGGTEDLSGTITTNGPNLIGGSPLLAALGNYGGPTQTLPPLPGSPAIDGATNGTAYAVDQRGFPREIGAFADLGAVESGNAIPGMDYTVVTTAGDFLSEWSDNGVSLRSAVAFAPNDSTITFTNTLSGATIGLTNGQLTLSVNLTIDASALPGGVILDGMSSNRVFWCNAGTTNALIGLTIVAGAAPRGAGIRNNGVLTVEQCTVSSNSASVYGGGFYNGSGASLTINNSTLSGNTADGGGGISTYGTLTVQNSTLSGNTASSRGGGIWGYTVTVQNSTLSGNTATDGGGIFNETSSTVTVQDSTLSGNTATNSGGGIYGDLDGTVTVQNSTFSGNTASNYGGGIFNDSSGLILENSIVAGNSAPFSTNIFGPSISTGTNLTSGDPQLAPLGDYGGPTQTMPPLPGSPAIDAGLSTTNTPATDQRGFARVIGTLDIGAVESGQAIPGMDYTVVTTAADFLSEWTDNGVSLRSAVAFATGGSAITFSNTLSGGTLVLTNGQITLSTNLAIDASSLADGIQINGNANGRIFQVNSGTTVVLDSLTLTNGAAPSFGGGIYNAGNLTVNRCTIAGNAAGSKNGGGIFNDNGALTLNQSTLSGNSAAYGGAVFNATDGIPSLASYTAMNQCTLVSNTASSNGGAVYNVNGWTFMTNCTVTLNSAPSGAGVWTYGDTATETVVANSIIAGNTASAGGDLDRFDTSNPNAFLSGGFNLIGTGMVTNFTAPGDLTNQTVATIKLASLADNGGPTQTMPPLPGSPAVDAGNDATASGFAYDQRGPGFPRVSGDHVDIGAVELQLITGSAPVEITDLMSLGDGTFQFGFTNDIGASFRVLATTNVALPATNWLFIGFATETPPSSGQFQFTDPGATNFPQRYYRVKSP